MLRRFAAAGIALLFVVGLILADESKGKITKIAEKGKISVLTVKVGDKDETFRIGKRTKIVNAKGDEIKAADLKVDNEVTVTWEEVEKNGKKRKQVSEVKVTK
jgi:hypothetical protein